MIPLISLAQTDSIVFINGNYIVGEIKDMDKGVVEVETDYSDSDFKIEWKGIKELYTKTHFLITLSDGKRYNGNLSTLKEDTVIIHSNAGEVHTFIKNIVFLKVVDHGFWNRLSASVDLGYSYSKTNNLQQTSMRSDIGYMSSKWSSDLSFSSVSSTQDDVDPIDRIETSLTYRYFLPKDFYVVVNMTFLSNTEQKLDLRTSSRIGLGKYLIHTNKSYLGFHGGLSVNREKYAAETDLKKSIEGYAGGELNIYDIGDLNLLTNVLVYPSITEDGRWRSDFKFDIKYDLPLDFYIKLGTSLNYDNQPVEGASETDYVFQASFGWEL